MFIGTSWLHSRSRTWSLYLTDVLVINQEEVKLLIIQIIQGLTIDLTQNFTAWVARLCWTTGIQFIPFYGTLCCLSHIPNMLQSVTKLNKHSVSDDMYTFNWTFISYSTEFVVVTLALLAVLSISHASNLNTRGSICYEFMLKSDRSIPRSQDFEKS
jgi:hypothetical protein